MKPVQLDSCAWAVYLEVPATKVVLLQALFETYEGLATVRTMERGAALVCVLTTDSLLSDCLAALESLRAHVPFRMVEGPADRN